MPLAPNITAAEFEARFRQLVTATATARMPGNAGYNEYMRGTANGLTLAQATFENKDPVYIEQPAHAKTLDRELLKRAINALSFDAQLGMADAAVCAQIFDMADTLMRG